MCRGRVLLKLHVGRLERRYGGKHRLKLTEFHGRLKSFVFKPKLRVTSESGSSLVSSTRAHKFEFTDHRQV
ncbi:hypothetical protein FVE85_2706 [Porphyridium purpureum]|uniref:Uncharacterized protein n=1 Tax=Porphyridium purpureum TaxID=35688 RepID=A0A5J4YTC4_PORPP|nr:hypothetical protein FVE85_2706 [Porphyridium purpureum]|eukprot:POR0778..scf227_4